MSFFLMLQDSRNLKIIELQKGQDSLLWVSYSDKEAESEKLCLSRFFSFKKLRLQVGL